MTRLGKVILAVFLATAAYSAVGELLGWDGYRSREGQACGPQHSWVYARWSAAGGDISCEPD